MQSTTTRTRARQTRPAEPGNPSILERLARGDGDAMQACIDEYGGLVLSIARRHLGRGEVDDAVQEVYIALWRCADRFDPERGSELAFIATLTQRKLIDIRRRCGSRRRLIQRSCARRPLSEHAPSPDAQPDRETAKRAAAALRELPPEVQDTLALSICRGLTYRNIAASVGAPNGTVKSWASRGLHRLREKLQVPVSETPLADVA